MRKLTKLSVSTAALATAALTATSALATDGYFQHGFGARNKAMGGAGIADGRDATILAINPAGLVDAGDNLTFAVSLFMPDRGYVGSGPGGFVPEGDIKGNDQSIFLVPNFAYSRPMGENTYFGVSLHGNGGMNTDYDAIANPACAMPMLPAHGGVFCGGGAGVNLNQAFLAVGLAHDFGGFSIGVSPILAVQQFKAKGLAAFGGVSADPTNLTNKGTDTTFGGGVRVGVQADLVENVRLAASYQTKVWMGRFNDYAGLFADGGKFDIPQNIQAGVAVDLTPNFTVAFDYRWINYEGVGSVSNSPNTMLPFGFAGGPGFGWKDVSAYKFGAEYRMENGMALRAGYGHNTNPVDAEDVTLNILAPGIVTDHFTGGFELPFGERQSFEATIMYAPENNVSGIEVTPFGANPNRTIDIGLSELEFTLGWKLRF